MIGYWHFTRARYREYTGRHQHVSIDLSESARRAIRVFRVLLLLTAADERQFTRSLGSFDDEELARYIIEFDACLFGIGILWFRHEDDGSETLMGGSAVDLTPFFNLARRPLEKLRGSHQHQRFFN